MMKTENGFRKLFLVLLCLCLTVGCAARSGDYPRAAAKKSKVKAAAKRAVKPLARMGYTIQAGAFSKVENAAKLAVTLQSGGLNAIYFVAGKGLYKVQFGNFSSREEARERAELLKAVGVIDDFYIVSPEEYAVAHRERFGETYLREELIKTAGRFVGVPYLWGGTSAETGFDCSGLMMAVYQLNGLDLPRSSREQFAAGEPVEQGNLERGDLIFFSTASGGKISHVGIYVGDGKFIHAPGRGKNIRTDGLSSVYYRKHYAGARSYL